MESFRFRGEGRSKNRNEPHYQKRRYGWRSALLRYAGEICNHALAVKTEIFSSVQFKTELQDLEDTEKLKHVLTLGLAGKCSAKNGLSGILDVNVTVPAQDGAADVMIRSWKFASGSLTVLLQDALSVLATLTVHYAADQAASQGSESNTGLGAKFVSNGIILLGSNTAKDRFTFILVS
jgi:hypothetical protein